MKSRNRSQLCLRLLNPHKGNFLSVRIVDGNHLRSIEPSFLGNRWSFCDLMGDHEIIGTSPKISRATPFRSLGAGKQPFGALKTFLSIKLETRDTKGVWCDSVPMPGRGIGSALKSTSVVIDNEVNESSLRCYKKVCEVAKMFASLLHSAHKLHKRGP